MRYITIRDILKVTNGYIQGKVSEDYRETLLSEEVKDIVTDSREVHEGSLFVTIVGENVDAHKFIPEVALKTDVMLVEKDEEEITALSDGSQLPENKAYIRVRSTVEALQNIAGFIRSRYNKPIIGVTGSVGKTTTREMITHTLESGLKVFHTQGNMNSQIGVPITVYRILDEDSDVAVLEMGISESGGMDKLVNIVKPDIAVCTMIGVAHIEFLKTREGIMKEKLRIALSMDESGALFINSDDELLSGIKGNNDTSFVSDDGQKLKCKVIRFGTTEDADYRAEDIRFVDGYNSYTFVHGDQRIPVILHQFGKHNVLNSLVSMAIADYMGLDLMNAASSLETFVGLRQKTINSDKGYTIIDDTYNASPDSMKAAINVLADITATGRKIAVLGDMFELGPDSDNYHKEVGEYLLNKYNTDESSIDELICIGKSSEFIADYMKDTNVSVSVWDNNESAAEYIEKIIHPGDVIILKASNGMHFSEIVNKIK